MMVTKKNVMLFEEFHAQKALNEGKKKEQEDEGMTLTKDEESDILDIEDLIEDKKISLATKALDALKKSNKEIGKCKKFTDLVAKLERASGKKK